MKNSNHYTSNDLIRYHQGKMSSQEMHDLEKAALTDPFLSDALEGFAQPTNFNKEKLILELSTHKSNSHKKTIIKPYFKYIGIAALLTGVIFGITNLKNNKPITPPPTPTKEDHSILQSTNDSTSPLLAQNNTDNQKSVETNVSNKNNDKTDLC